MGDHTESLQVDFDPTEISFEEVMSLFWKSHNPIGAIRCNQYMSAIWYADQSQLDGISSAGAAIEERLQQKVTTPVLELATFYNAENYHQKYGLQQYRNLMKRFEAMYPEFDDFNKSTAAARLNGFVSRGGPADLLDEERESYGIPADEIDTSIR